MTNQQITDIVVVGCALLALIAFGALVVAPAVSSYRRGWERAIAVVLSAYVFFACVGVGVVLGVLIIYEWPRYF